MGLVVLYLGVDVHCDLAVFVACQILNCLGVNRSVYEIGNVGVS